MIYTRILFCAIFMVAVSENLSADDVSRNHQIARQLFLDPGVTTGPRLVIVQESNPGEIKINRNVLDGPIRLGEKTYQNGIGMNAPARLRIVLEKPAERFLADIGIDRNAEGGAGGTCRFHVLLDGKPALRSEVLTLKNSPQSLNVPLNGAMEFELLLDDGGDGRGWDQGDWADARIVYQDGSEARLDNLGPLCGINRLPFQFLYDGKPSTEILGSWDKSLETKEFPNEKKTVHSLKWTDPETQLELKAVVTVYTDTPGIDWTLYVTNKGSTDSKILTNLNVLNATLWNRDNGAPIRLHRLAGSVAGATDWLPSEETIPFGKTVDFAPLHGRSSMGASPFFTVQGDTGGVVTAVGWTGRWKASVARIDGPGIIKVGLQKLNLSLKPGETIRTPRVLQTYWSGSDLDAGHNAFRRTMFAHVHPRIEGEPVVPPIAHMTTAFYIMDQGTEKDVLDFLEKSQGLGFEYLWHDAFYAPKHFPAVGDYALPLKRSFDPVRFPNGFSVISRKTHEAGQKFLQWYEPERICAGSIVATEHSDWVVLPSGEPWGGIDLGIPEAWEFVYSFLKTNIQEYSIDCLRIDNAVNYDALWNVLDERNGPDRLGIAEIRYVEGLYALWDKLLQEFPNMFIDNCASGGQRIDLETCARSIPLWRTDATIGPLNARDFMTSALYNQVISHGLNRYLPYSTSGQMGTTPYLFRSGFNGGIPFADDFRPENFPRAELKKAISEGKRIRKYFAGNYYPLSTPSLQRDAWCMMQYHRPEESDGMIMIFRRDQSPFAAISHLPLKEIDPEAEYEIVISRTFEPETPRKMSGNEFLKLKIDVDERPGSVVLEYKKR